MELGFKFITGPARPASTDVDEVDFTIVIAHRGSALGLWATVHACEVELAGSKWKYNYVLVPNGEEKWHIDEERIWHFLEKAGKIRDLIKVHEPLSPPSARNRGAEMANGKYIFFFDNHCIPARGYFDSAIRTMEEHGGMVHSMTRFYAGEMDHWHYELTLKKNFWGNCLDTKPPVPGVPYRIAVAGHGGFAVPRKVWKDVGGYWDGFVGYGGEEVYFDFKLWLLGHSVWLDPNMIHYHFAGERGYARHYTDDYFRNMLMCSNIIGGQKWFDAVMQSSMKYPRQRSDNTMLDIAMDAQQRSALHAYQIEQRRHKSLDELLSWFKTENISH